MPMYVENETLVFAVATEAGRMMVNNQNAITAKTWRPKMAVSRTLAESSICTP